MMQAVQLDQVNERYAELLRAVEAERLARRLRMNRRRKETWRRNENARPKLDLALWLRPADDGAEIKVR